MAPVKNQSRYHVGVMTSTETRAVRRASRFASAVTMLSIVAGGVILASPAHANVPEGWSNPADVDPLSALLLLGGIPLAMIVVIGLMVYLPGIVRGENLSGGSSSPDPEWFGGPSKRNDELAAPDTDESQAGGASGKW